jgi:putative Mg2+ transporter-C (MgtC) family protein
MQIPATEVVLRLVTAACLGGLIGLEREIQGKEAGFRTYSAVALGAALIMLVSLEIAFMYQIPSTDPSRIAAQVVSGIGFLGAGAIIRFSSGAREVVTGLTTAAGLWVSAGIGLGCGLGLYFASIFTTVLMLVIFLGFLKIDRIIEERKKSGAK